MNDQTTSFVMDISSGLPQTLADGTNTYLDGAGRMAQQHGTVTEYFMGDAPGSVRQIVDEGGTITHPTATPACPDDFG
jgi:hypothetical protein